MCVGPVASLFGGGSKSPALPPITAPPAPIDTTNINNKDAQAASLKEAQKAALAKGLSSTINTSPLGDTSTPNIYKAKLGQ